MTVRLTWQKPGQSEALLREYLILALLRSGVCVTLQDRQLNYLYIANLPALWSVRSTGAPTDNDLFGDRIAKSLIDLKSKSLETGCAQHIELSANDDKIFEFHIELVETPDSGPHVLTTVIDLSEKRRREKVLRALLREVSHRSKNLLAIIQSIASQTARHSGSLNQFLSRFTGRLHSLAQSQDLVTDTSWRGAEFKDLVRNQVQKYVRDGMNHVAITGDDVLLSPNAALHIGLAIHELIVNAVSCGSLAINGPQIVVSCKKTRANGHDFVEISWAEPLTASCWKQRTGHAEDPEVLFTSTVLQRVVPQSVDGTADYEISDKQVFYRLRLPADTEEQNGMSA